MEASDKLDSAFINGSVNRKLVTVPAATDTLLLPRSRNRIAVYIFGTIATVNYVAPEAMAATSQGIGVSSSNPLQVSQRTHGDLATEEWHAYSQVGCNLYVVEVMAGCPCATGH